LGPWIQTITELIQTLCEPRHPVKSCAQNAANRRVCYVEGRYIRTGVAKWFVFDEIDTKADVYRLSGSLRSYNALVDDRTVGEPKLVPSTHRDDARLFIDGSDLLEVRSASGNVARAAVAALDVAARIQPMNRIPFIDTTAPAVRGELHDASKFMLDLLVNRLPAAGLAS
jgi:hypothetical protein